MDIMQAILEIESKASGIKKSADNLKQQQSEAIKSELEAKEIEYKKKLDAAYADMKKESYNIREEKMEAIERVFAEKLEFMEKSSAKNTDKWVEQIAEAVIKA